MTAKLTATLREAPTTVPALAAVALFVVWAANQAGYPLTHWAPGGLLVLALLAIAFGFVRGHAARMPRAVLIALLALAAYTALSFLSILWAGVPGDAWEGADRTLLYLLVFALFACWPRQGASAGLLLCLWTLALIVLAAVTALHVNAAHGAALQAMLPGGRLEYPSGYPNANAAEWLMAFWPAALLARGERLPAPLRGVLAGGAVLLAEVALLSQSRGSLYATPVMLVLVFAFVPARVRTLALLVPIAVGVGAAAPATLAVGDHLRDGAVTTGAVHHAVLAMFAAAVGVGLVVSLGAFAESRSRLSGATRGRIHRTVATAALVLLVAGIAGGLAVAGNPVHRVKEAWHSFKSGYGTSSSNDRLVIGLGSNRYDFYRVALDEFVAHPVLGIGADNFQQQYLIHGRSSETPHYPHSVELRTLSQTGLVGALLALAGLAGALIACWRAMRRADPLGRYVAAAALAGFGYWVVHGSFDWFWEFAGLGAPAFALLGLACSLAPARTPAPARARGDASGEPARRLSKLRPALAAFVAVAALAAVVSLGAPWLSRLQVQSAAKIWTQAPREAYARLSDAARLNPLSDEPYVVAGSIALRYEDLPRAEREFSRALGRDSGDAYATLELGAIASARGRQAQAVRLLERAVQLDPREPLTREALRTARSGKRVDIDALNRSILLKAQQLA